MARLKIEIADTPATLAQGLMYRGELPSDKGMLFKFPMVLDANFWGKNTYIPLDVAFVNNDRQITSIRNIVPMSTRVIHSGGNCIMAIEANAGFFDKNGVKEGHKVDFIRDKEGNETEVVFLTDA